MKVDNRERLDKIYEKYDIYFSTYFGRTTYEDGVRHMDRFLSLMVTMAIKSKKGMYERYIKRYGEVFDQAELKDKDALEKLNKGKKKGEEEELKESYVAKYKEVFNKNVLEFFKEGVILQEDGVNTVQIERLNHLFDKVKTHLKEPKDKRDVYESYLGTIDKLMNENFDGDNFEDWSDLEIHLNLFEIKDELNDILLEMDDLTADDVDNIMHGMELDIVRILDDLLESEEDVEDFEPLNPKPESMRDPDDEPVAKIISEEEEYEEDEFGDFEGLTDDASLDIDLDINLDEDNMRELKPKETKGDKTSEVKEGKNPEETKEDKKGDTLKEVGKEPEPELEDEDEVLEDEVLEDVEDFEVREVVKESKKEVTEVREEDSSEEEDTTGEEELENESEDSKEFELDSFLTASNDEDELDRGEFDESVDEDIDEDEYIEDEYESDIEDDFEEEASVDLDELGNDEEDDVADLDSILGSGADDEEVVKKKGKVVIDDEDVTLDLDKYL